MKSMFLSLSCALFSLNLAHASVTPQSYTLVQCDEGVQAQSLIIAETETGLSAQWANGTVESFNNINQGAQESYKFVALGLQYRIVTTVTANEDSITKTEKTFGHLIGSPLGIPRDSKIVEITAGLNEDEIQVALKKMNGFGLSLEKSFCTYSAE